MLMRILEEMETKSTVLPQEIAAKLGVSDDTVSLALERLTRLGYLRVKTQNAESGGCCKCPGWIGKCCQWAACGNYNVIKWYEKAQS